MLNNVNNGETMSTRDLINAIVANDAIEIENSFNSTMATKISDSMETLRKDVAQSMFTAVAQDNTEE